MAFPEVPSSPSRARHTLVLWLCGLSSILYLDRICMSQAVLPISAELHLSKPEMSYVLMAFTLAYGLFAVPAGRMADRFGARLALTLLVLAWSAFTAGTGLCHGLVALVIVRFLFGMAEAGAFPNAARIVRRWFPLGERGRVQGLMLGFAQFGAIVAPVVTAYIIREVGWRWVFFGYAVLGAIWAIGFAIWFRNDPAQHPRVNAAELARIHSEEPPPSPDPGPVPWGRVFTNRGILVLAAIMIFAAFFTYFFYSWFPKYLTEARQVSEVESGRLNSLAIAGSAIGMLLGGWISDRITRQSLNPIRDRRYACIVGFLVAAACMYAGTRCESALATAAFWSAAMCAMHVQLPNWWSVIIPQSGRHTATLFGLTNGVGSFGALASQWFVGWFSNYQEVERGLVGRAAWDPIFDVYVLVLIGGAVCWWLYRFTPLEEPDLAA
ncbi:MAG TPA: MFS transporter [Urbifossiella sp.]|nr:MFS transporter [Urbifossiella sp.]